MYDRSQYENFVKNNNTLTDCQKKELINTKRNIIYTNIQSDKQIQTYVHHAEKSEDFRIQTRLYLMFNHFIKHDKIDKLIKLAGSDTKVFDYILAHPEILQKKKPYDKKIYCSPYTYVFEKIALEINPRQSASYLDVACGDGFQTKLFATKLNLDPKNIWGTDIEEWGPYKLEKKKNLPINFKFITDNKLNFTDNQFDIVSTFFGLHHIPTDSLHKLLKEISRVLKPGGRYVIFEHNIVNDFDHLIVDIDHSMYSYIIDRKPYTDYSYYMNYMEFDFVFSKYGLVNSDRYPLTNNIGFDVRFDNPYYASYVNKK